MNEIAKKILEFWFIKSTPEEKFTRTDAFDKKIKNNFFDNYKKAILGKYDFWQNSPQECLALIILLDQFSRNLFRGDSKAFAADNKCTKISKLAIKNQYHQKLPTEQILFIFLPLMHSEKLEDQIYCNELIDSYLINHPKYNEIKKFSVIHYDIIKKFGRFPHRNKVLDRDNTKEENEYLKSTHYDFFNI